MPKCITKNVPLAPLTTLGVGGCAEYYAPARSHDELREIARFALREHLPLTVLGGGSNVLISDSGVRGIVLHPEFHGIAYEELGDTVSVTAEAGVVFDELIKETTSRKLWGLENLSGIPGTVGGVPIQNVGAYGVEVKNIITSVRVYDIVEDAFIHMTNEACAFGYRESLFKRSEGKRYVVIGVTFALSKIPRPVLEYKDLAPLREKQESPTITEVRDTILAVRAQKFPDWRVVGTAGSFFKNPIISRELYESLLATYPELPGFSVGKNHVKIALGYVLDRICGLRGHHEGNVSLFEHQALVLTCTRTATTAEVTSFADRVIACVHKKIGIMVEREVTELQ